MLDQEIVPSFAMYCRLLPCTLPSFALFCPLNLASHTGLGWSYTADVVVWGHTGLGAMDYGHSSKLLP